MRFKRSYLIPILPIALISGCLVIIWWMNFSFQLSLQIYPGAQSLGRAYGYYGSSSGLEVQYFWIADPVESVKSYYEKFTLPFRNNAWDGGLISVISGNDLSYMDVNGVLHQVGGSNEMRCHYTQRYSCINVRLVDIDTENEMANLPIITGSVSSSDQNAAPIPLSESLKSGTLIIYSYYIHDL